MNQRNLLSIRCTAGITNTDLIGDLPGYVTVWYHPGLTANILSVELVWEFGQKTTCLNHDGNVFQVKKRTELIEF